MANVYTQRDDVIQGMMDAMHSRLRNGTGAGGMPVRRTDNSLGMTSTPSWVSLPPLKITPVSASHKRLNLDGTAKK